MIEYFAQFQVVGEIADMLLLKPPVNKLLVDISLDPPGHEADAFKKHPTRISFTIVNRVLIERFLSEVSVGDIAEAQGSFSQSGYIPHKTTYIDTTFVLTDYRLLQKQSGPVDRRNISVARGVNHVIN